MPPVRPRQWTSTRPASPMISAIRSGDGYCPDAPDEVGVGAALAGDPADQRHDPVEPPAHEPREAAPRPGDLEAQDAAPGPHRACHLLEPAAVVGQVAHAEGDRGGVEARIVGRQGEGVPDDVLEPGPRAVLAARDVDHAGRDVDPDDPAAGLRAPLEVGRDLAGAGGDVQRTHPRLQPGAPGRVVRASTAPGTRRSRGSSGRRRRRSGRTSRGPRGSARRCRPRSRRRMGRRPTGRRRRARGGWSSSRAGLHGGEGGRYRSGEGVADGVGDPGGLGDRGGMGEAVEGARAEPAGCGRRGHPRSARRTARSRRP